MPAPTITEKLELIMPVLTEDGEPVLDKGGNPTFRTFSPKRRTPSAKLRSELRSIATTYEKLKIDAIGKLDLPEGDSHADAVDFARKHPAAAIANVQVKEAMQSINDERTIVMAIAIINTDLLRGQELELVTSSPTEDFWQGQDLEALEVWVDRFCGRNSIG